MLQTPNHKNLVQNFWQWSEEKTIEGNFFGDEKINSILLFFETETKVRIILTGNGGDCGEVGASSHRGIGIV